MLNKIIIFTTKNVINEFNYLITIEYNKLMIEVQLNVVIN